MSTTTPTSRVASAFAPEFLADVLAGEFTLITVCEAIDDEPTMRPVKQALTLDLLDDLISNIELHNANMSRRGRLGYDIPTGIAGDAAKEFICEHFAGDDCFSRILSNKEVAAAGAKKLDSFIASLNLPGTPGSVEWFDALELAYDREAGENSGERKAERYAEMRFGAQSEEGFYSDSDTASVNAGKLNEVWRWAEKHLPASYALWLESRK